VNLGPGGSREQKNRLQSYLLSLAACFVIVAALILTFSPAVRLHSFDVEFRWSHWLGVLVWLAGFFALHRQVIRHLPASDPYLLPTAALLSGWGLILIWRLDEDFGLRQTMWLGICLALLWILVRVKRIFSRLRRYKYLWLVMGLALTGLTFFLGTYPGGVGPHLWLGAAGIYLQPSEPLKLLLVVYLAAYLADQLPIGFNLLQMLTPTLVMILAALGILVAQRDMGTATIFILLYAALVFIASGQRRILAISAAILGVAGAAGYQLLNVIQVRINSWVNPWADPTGTSYQVIQSLISTGAGGVFGTGLGLGSPGVVPVAHSDFIFSALSEEFGLLGTGALFILIALLTIRGLNAALRARSIFQRYLAAGLTIFLVMQSLVIIGGNLGVLPLTGVTLPFVSYGGSSLLTSFHHRF
jgi:cell division protein FtsW (lipid II flippase)